MYLLAKFGDRRSYRNGDINSYINSDMDSLEKAGFMAPIHHTGRLLKSEIPIYNSKVLDTASRKTRRRRRRRRRRRGTQAIAKCHAFHANVSRLYQIHINTRLEVLYKKGVLKGVFHRKTPVPVFFFNKFSSLSRQLY